MLHHCSLRVHTRPVSRLFSTGCGSSQDFRWDCVHAIRCRCVLRSSSDKRSQATRRLRSPPQYRFQCAEFSDEFWTSRFASPTSNHTNRCRTFQSFGALRNLPCATESSVCADSMRRIGFCAVFDFVSVFRFCAWIERARIPAFSRQGLLASSPRSPGAGVGKLERATPSRMRRGAPRSNLRAPVCLKRLEAGGPPAGAGHANVSV